MTATCNLHTEEKRQLNTEWQKQEKLWGDLNYCCLSMYAVCSMIPFNCYHCRYRVGMPMSVKVNAIRPRKDYVTEFENSVNQR